MFFIKRFLLLIVIVCFYLFNRFGRGINPSENRVPQPRATQAVDFIDSTSIREVNGNVPFFTAADLRRADKSFEEYSPLDKLGRCGVAFARIGLDVMPTEKRGPIGMVKPSGWQLVKYDFVEGKYLYNRCHLIGFQLAGENANPRNLITGTRWLNVMGMLPYENQVADYVKRTGDYVLYRVTPMFKGNELVARGVLMEAASLGSDKVTFCVFVPNIQPNVVIDYNTGKSRVNMGKKA